LMINRHFSLDDRFFAYKFDCSRLAVRVIIPGMATTD
jgi:hypothetical protein